MAPSGLFTLSFSITDMPASITFLGRNFRLCLSWTCLHWWLDLTEILSEHLNPSHVSGFSLSFQPLRIFLLKVGIHGEADTQIEIHSYKSTMHSSTLFFQLLSTSPAITFIPTCHLHVFLLSWMREVIIKAVSSNFICLCYLECLKMENIANVK